MKKMTTWRIAVVLWAVFVTGVLVFKVQEPEPIYIEMPAPTPGVVYKTEVVEVGQEAHYASIASTITESERELLAKATYLEAGNQSITGQRAVVEVIRTSCSAGWAKAGTTSSGTTSWSPPSR